MMMLMMMMMMMMISYLLSIYLKLFGSGPENEPKDAFVEDAGPQSDSEVDK